MEKKENSFIRCARVFVSAVLAGACVGLGGIVFLSLESKILGALFFAVGLFTICTFKLHLFTGKVCYVFENNAEYALQLPLIWLGNLLGTFLTAQTALLTRYGTSVSEKAAALCEAKLNDSFLSLFLLGLLCNILIYIAVEGYLRNPHELGKYLSILFGVTVFILSGTEHSVADMFYLSAGRMWSAKALGCVLTVTLGNACGGVLMPLLRRLAHNN